MTRLQTDMDIGKTRKSDIPEPLDTEYSVALF